MKSSALRFGLLRSAILAGSLLLIPAASGCATTRVYHLNLDITTAPATFAAIANTAEAMGYQVTRMAIAVNVRYDKETWIYYGLQTHDYNMAIVVSNDIADDQLSARLESAKAKGEEIWGRAMAIRQPPLPQLQPTAAPAPTPPAT